MDMLDDYILKKIISKLKDEDQISTYRCCRRCRNILSIPRKNPIERGDAVTLIRDPNTNWYKVFYTACSHNYPYLLSVAIKKGVNHWNWGLLKSCRGGHLDIVNIVIKKGANNWNWGLCGACYGGHLNIINLMIENKSNYYQNKDKRAA